MQKTCNKCLQTKTLDKFSKNSTAKFGVSSCCKDCQSLYNKAYREKHRESLLQADRERYANNREELKAKAIAYKSLNRDYYEDYNKSYYLLNKHKFLAYNSKRRKVIMQATPKWLSQGQKQQIEDIYWLAQDLQAVSDEIYHVDHIVPLRGNNVCGLHVAWNLQILPADLNLQKSNKYEPI